MRFSFHKQLCGIEISSNAISAAKIVRDKLGWRLINGITVPLPSESLQLSYQKTNVADADLLIATLREAIQQAGIGPGWVGLAIPNEVVKVSIQKLEELPSSRKAVEKMLAWHTEKTMHFPADSTRISYQRLESVRGDDNLLLVSVAIKAVVQEYELKLRELKLDPVVVQPAGINQFNFYRRALPGSGIIAFLGLYESCFTFFVFEDANMTFYHSVKRGFSDLHFFQDVDMTMQHYSNVNPDKEIERLYVGSQVAFHRELRDVFRNLSDMEVEIIDESRLILTDMNLEKEKERERLSAVASAVGAAQSLMR
ncbi:MAG: type IV pilus biogenesis protein PilM [Thermodesulfobacteriota bacterium]